MTILQGYRLAGESRVPFVNAHEKLIAFLEVERVIHQFVVTLIS